MVRNSQRYKNTLPTKNQLFKRIRFNFITIFTEILQGYKNATLQEKMIFVKKHTPKSNKELQNKLI